MPSTAKKNEALAEGANGDAAVLTFVDELPAKAQTVRTNWLDGVLPQLDANPGPWALVYEGVGDNPDRNALSRSVRTKRTLTERDLLGKVYEVEKRGAQVFMRHV